MCAARCLPRRLIVKPGQTLFSPQHRQNIEYSGRRRASRKGSTQRLGYGAKLQAVLVGKGAHRGFRRRSRPILDRIEGDAEPADQLAALRCQQGSGLGVDLEWPVGKDIVRAIDQLDQRFRALFQAWHGLEKLSAGGRVELALEIGSVGN